MAARRPLAGDAVTTPSEFLGGEPAGDTGGGADERTFAFGHHLHGAFGGVFGGALAAATVLVARDVAPGRMPASLDCRFLRALPAGRAVARPTTLHAGRSMTTVAVDLVDERGRTATHATITLVDCGALAPVTLHAVPLERAHDGVDGVNGEPWRNPPGVEAPIIDTLKPRTTARPARSGTQHPAGTAGVQVPEADGGTIATAIDVPWDPMDGDAAAEAVCLAADLCVGPPVAAACRGRRRRLAHPNPDVSLRFAAATIPPGTPVVATGRLAALDAGLATVAVEVTAAGRTLAIGASFSVLLETG